MKVKEVVVDWHHFHPCYGNGCTGRHCPLLALCTYTGVVSCPEFLHFSSHTSSERHSVFRSLQTLLQGLDSPMQRCSSLSQHKVLDPQNYPGKTHSCTSIQHFHPAANPCSFTEVTASEEGLFSRFYVALTVMSKLNIQNVILKNYQIYENQANQTCLLQHCRFFYYLPLEGIFGL